MIDKICSQVLYGVLGWKKNVTVTHPRKCIICLAPHTSNWDFVIGQLYMRAERMKINFMMKKEWFFFPLGAIFKRMGGIPVWRSKHTSMTDNIAEQAIKANDFLLCITPEGTRSPNPEWKRGFYYIALKAGIPILLYAADYSHKLIQCDKVITPTGDIDQDIRKIKQYYKNFKGKHPEKFTTGE